MTFSLHPPPRRGSHFKSDNTHTIINILSLAQLFFFILLVLNEFILLALNKLNEFIFAWPCVFGQPSRTLVVITWRGVGCRYMMQLGETVKREQLPKTKAKISSVLGWVDTTPCTIHWCKKVPAGA